MAEIKGVGSSSRQCHAQDEPELNEDTPLISKTQQKRLEQDKAAEGLATSLTIYFTAMSVSVAELSKLSVMYLLKDVFMLGPADAAFYSSFASLGWVIKPLWGYISDSFPILGQRRRPYVVIMSFLAAAMFASYSVVASLSQFMGVLILTHSAMSFLTVIAQALLVHRSGHQAIDAASYNFSSYFGLKTVVAAGLLLVGGGMLDTYGARAVLKACGGPFLVLFFTALFMEEPGMRETLPVSEQWRLVKDLFTRPEVLGATLFIFTTCLMPSSQYAMFFFNVDELHFSARFLSLVQVGSSAAEVAGLFFYHKFLTRVPFRTLFWMSGWLCTLVSLTPIIQIFHLNRRWGIDDHVFALVDNVIIDGISEVLWIPMMVLASRLCPPSVEGLSMAMFLSIHNLGLWASGAVSGGLMKWLGVQRDQLENLWILVLICSFSTLVPLVMLPLIPAVDPALLRNAERPGVGGSSADPSAQTDTSATEASAAEPEAEPGVAV